MGVLRARLLLLLSWDVAPTGALREHDIVAEATTEAIRCESVKDSGFGLDFSSYPQESASNRGASSSVQVKTYQEAFAASFDLSARE